MENLQKLAQFSEVLQWKKKHKNKYNFQCKQKKDFVHILLKISSFRVKFYTINLHMYIYLSNKHDWNINFDFIAAPANGEALVKPVTVVRHLEIKGIEKPKTTCRVHLFLIYHQWSWRVFLNWSELPKWLHLNILKSKGFEITLKMLLEV